MSTDLLLNSWRTGSISWIVQQKITVHHEHGAKEFATTLFGRIVSDSELAAAVGALPGAIVQVRLNRGELLAEINHPWVKIQKRRFRRDTQGDVYLFNEKLIKAATAPPSTGLRILAMQATFAPQLGIKRFEIFAQGYARDPEYKGYLVWPLCGYDALLTARDKVLLPPHLSAALTVLDLIERGERDWWEANGDARRMSFDLTPGSRSMKILTHRLITKGLLECIP